MTQYKPIKQKKNRLLAGALVVTTAASIFFGAKYYSTRQVPSQAGQVQSDNTPMEERVRDLYNSVVAKTTEIIPAVQNDYKKIAGYGGTGVLAGLVIAYLAKRKR